MWNHGTSLTGCEVLQLAKVGGSWDLGGKMFPNISLLWWRAEVFLTWEKRWFVTLVLDEQQKMRKRKYLLFLFPFEVPRSVSADGPSNENNLRRTISVMATTDVYAFQYRRGSYKESLVKKFMVWWKTFELSLVSEQHHGSMYKETPTCFSTMIWWHWWSSVIS